MKLRLALSILLPIATCVIQWLLWDLFKPYVWFLFFPAAFFSAWIGGLTGGLAATVIGALLVWYVFIPPFFSLTLDNPASTYSIVVFIIMGGLFAFFFERLQQAMRRTDEALAAAEAAKEKITALYEKTRELDELKTQFFANVSHELRTPLTLILAPLEKRLRQPAETDPTEARREDERMLRNARLLYRQVSDLLDAAKLEAGRMRLNYARLDLAELTRAMVSHFDSVAKERGIAYRCETPATLTGEADGEKVQRILLNLLSNAFKFTPDGGRILVRLGTEGEEMVLTVEDNGPGVPAAMREAVFERFRQLEGSAQRRRGGTGLGLAIVREFVELHGGAVAVGESPDGGACFTVRLPRTAPPDATLEEGRCRIDHTLEETVVDELRPVAPTALPDSPAAAENGPLVLVVEDNPDMNAFVAEALRPHYRVATASNGREGIAKALALAPDLILCDVMMPEMSGDEMVLELRQLPEMAEVPIIMLTAKADDALRVRLLQAGVQDYINKPFAVAEVLARVGGLLRERRRTGKALQTSEARFEAIFDQAAVGMALVAPDGRWQKVNRKLCSIVGYTEAELLAKNFQDITHPDDLDTDLDHVRRMLAKEITTYTLEKRYFHKDGGIVWSNLTVALAWKTDGTPDYFISAVEDISARKAADTELKRRNEELERFDRAAIGREMEMIRLKEQVNDLARQLGMEPPHALNFIKTAEASSGDPEAP